MFEIKSAMAVACLCPVDWTYRLRGMDWFPFVNDRINVRTHVCIYLFLTIEDIIYEICIINVILILQLIGKDWIQDIAWDVRVRLFHIHFFSTFIFPRENTRTSVVSGCGSLRVEIILAEARQTRAGRQKASNKRDFGVFDSLSHRSHRVDSAWKTGSSLSPLKSAHCACGRLVCADVSSSSSLVNISSTRHANHNTWLVQTWSRKSATDPNKPTPNMRTRATLGWERDTVNKNFFHELENFDIFK